MTTTPLLNSNSFSDIVRSRLMATGGQVVGACKISAAKRSCSDREMGWTAVCA